MVASRTKLLERLDAYSEALETDIVVDRTIGDQRGRLVRNGLIIVGFAALEDFVRSRTREALERIESTLVKFDDLPPGLRTASTQETVRALSFQIRLLNQSDEDPVGLIRRTGDELASTGRAHYVLSPLSFASSRSNLGADEIKAILKVFHVNDGWGQIDRVAARVGLGGPSHEDAFRNAARWRNEAAHSATADTQPTDLKSFRQHALGIAFGFDVLLSRAVRPGRHPSKRSPDSRREPDSVSFRR